MHLAQNRQWWSVFDPLVMIVTEFNYGDERIAIPKIIGPTLLKKQTSADQARQGVIIRDACVSGPHPYRGGDITISVALYQVERINHARVILNLMESISSSLGAPSDLEAIGKTGAALLEGVEGLLGLGKTSLLAGIHMSLAPSPLDPFSAGFTALITPPAPPIAQLCVEDRQLKLTIDGGVEHYRGSDFVLIGVHGTQERSDENVLPFYHLKEEAMAAVLDGEDGIKRGKANLIAAYQQMRKSPDVTTKEVGQLFERWLQEFQKEKSRLESTMNMSIRELEHVTRPQNGLAADLDDALKRIDL